MKLILHIAVLILGTCNLLSGQTFSEILGRPTNSSVTMNILFDQNVDVYWEYGTSSGMYPMSTPTITASKDVPVEYDIVNLLANTRYYYRTRYRDGGGTGDFVAGTEHHFQTQRPKGNSFTFAIESDPHMDTNSNPSAYALTLQNISAKGPDFMLDLGDIFMSEKLPNKIQSEITKRHVLYRPYYGEVCPSVPLYIVIGNHEGELGWSLDGTANSLPVMASNTRKLYYPNPLPNSFYTGDTVAENFVGLRGNYYAWEWGNALFIVLDPYWYTVTKPGWGWTLGAIQYNWFKKVITNSHARFKFVFCHQLVGGNGNDGRGGIEFARFWEQGGENADSTWGFNNNRPGWIKTVHELMIENNANIYFHGHDHFFGKQDMDGIVYQECPQPSNKNIKSYSASQYGYVNGVLMPGRGYLLINVTDTNARVDYIKTLLPSEETTTDKNGDIGYSYSLTSKTDGIAEYIDQTTDPQLGQNFPNPFQQETEIKYITTRVGEVQLSVYDVFGREITRLVDLKQAAGTYSVKLDASKLNMKPGIYYCMLTTEHKTQSKKMIRSN